MTPAERLAKRQPRKRSPRNTATAKRPVWRCRVRAKREELNLSIRAVADAVEFSPTALWQIEKGGDLVLTTARRLAQFFGCEISELWPGLAPARKAKP